MSHALISSNIWKKISAAAKSARKPAFVAVAYFGNGGSKLLPLKRGSTLLVDASERAVTSGQTNPAELLKLYRKGVKIFRHQGLHAKVFVFDSKTIVGSANVSSNSATSLIEAAIETTDRKVRNDAEAFVRGRSLYELGEEALSELVEIYEPPKFLGKKSRKRKIQKTSGVIESGEVVYVVKDIRYDDKDYAENEKESYKTGLRKAKEKRKPYSRHEVECFRSSTTQALRAGNLVVQIAEDDDGDRWVHPLGRITTIEKFRNKDGAYYYLEVEKGQRRRNLKRFARSNKIVRKALSRNGAKGLAVSDRIIEAFRGLGTI